MRESVYDLLKNFTGLEPLKRLFWSELNYDRPKEQGLPTRSWNESERALLANEPLLLAEHGEFKIIYGQMQDGLSRTAERTIINKMLDAFPYALFVFSDSQQRHWHFVNVKYDRDLSKRRIFRRITVEPSERLRTATERLSMLDLETISRDLFGISPLAIQQRHDQAFDVEAVTREFFREYDKIFRRAEAEITALPEDERRLFTQKLFNRLMFIMFLERKGWLVFNGRTDYLRALWEDYQRVRQQQGQGNFYWDRLYHLFFSGLNNPQNLMRINHGGYLASVIGPVPYLNGGLFEREDDDDNRNILISDKIFDAAVNELFYRYNFTVAESTPLDIEVAVDPEMLGKIFEELITGRHETGSYYTPKPVVSFMCREALKGYLQTALPHEPRATISRFVDEHDASTLRDPEAVLSALRRVTVCDPACGSGAYLLGMLQELLGLRASLFTAKHVDARSVYERKLEIIQRNLYGVDIDPFAINIAQLRLWLSLIVDFELGREGEEPPTLPNLDYKIEVGDSVLGPDPSGTSPREFDRLLVEQYVKAKDEYLKAHGDDKKRLHVEVEQLQSEIRMWARPSVDATGFDWAIEFAEVFDDGGFDIVLANPPYVRMELFKDIKPILKKNFADVHSDRADLYVYFYARAVQMLKQGGMLAFISSNKWFRANYGANLRHYIAKLCAVWSITDFGELPVFQTAATFPMIFIAKKDRLDDTQTIFTQVKSLGEPYPDVRALLVQRGQPLPDGAISGSNWTLSNIATVNQLRKMEAAGVGLAKYVNGAIYWGVKTGLNTAFIIDGSTRAALIAKDPGNREIIKPLAVGDDVRRWRIEQKDRWLLYMYHGVDARKYPTIIEHLMAYKEQLESRATHQEWYELQQPQMRYTASFNKPKIMYPIICKEPRFTLDTEGTFTNDKVFVIPVNDLYLLGVLNSNVVWEYLKAICSVLGDADNGGRLELRAIYMSRLPIPNASDADRTTIAALARKCLDAKGQGPEVAEWEAEINERVARLYGLEAVEGVVGVR